jgi:hypothetical protein
MPPSTDDVTTEPRSASTSGADDDRDTWLDDARLLARDIAQRGAQMLLVVVRDGRDTGHERCHEVRGIEAPAQADLQHGDVDARLRKQPERRRSRHFEVGRMDVETSAPLKRCDRQTDAIQRFVQGTGCDSPSIDMKALLQSNQVW